MNQLPLTPALRQFHLRTVENARDYLLGHFNEDVSLHQLAQHCHVSPFHFSRIFRDIMHSSPYQYLSALRLDHAKNLLGTTDQPVTDIAYACGYNSIEHFATAFRRRIGSSPSQYRKKAFGALYEMDRRNG
jgi:AraC-like DNA-binding protein